MQRIKFQKFIYTLKLFSFCLLFSGAGVIHFAGAEAQAADNATDTTSPDNLMKCAKPSEGTSSDKGVASDKKVFCFFSLNNEKEFQYVNSEVKMKYKNESGKWVEETDDDFEQRKQMLEAARQSGSIEIVEYYGADNKNQSVEERFKQMMKEQACDSLVISGHHAEYFTGQQSIGANNWKLNLDFMEEMSCQPGCEDWFANVKSLFLMGCNTVEGRLDSTTAKRSVQPESARCAEGNTADCKALYVTINNAASSQGEDKDWNLGILSQKILNQAYSSTLDQNTNPLSNRYLKIFPNSSLYGWSQTAPGVGALSRFSIPRFINMVSGLTPDSKPRQRDLKKGVGEGEPEVDAADIVRFLDVMNTQIDDLRCREFTASQWAGHWDSGTAPTSCYLKDDDTKNQYEAYQSQACSLNQTLSEKPTSTDDVQKAVAEILKSGPEGIRRNFNHLMNLIVQYRWSAPPDWYDKVTRTLQENDELRDVLVDNLTTDKNIGITKKADYLYVYKQVYGASKETEDKQRHQQVSDAFLDHLTHTYDLAFSLIDNTPESETLTNEDKFILVSEYHQSIQTSIVNNGDHELANWLYTHQEKNKAGPNRFDTLIKKYEEPELTKYLMARDVTEGDKAFYSNLVTGFCKKLKTSSPDICANSE